MNIHTLYYITIWNVNTLFVNLFLKININISAKPLSFLTCRYVYNYGAICYTELWPSGRCSMNSFLSRLPVSAAIIDVDEHLTIIEHNNLFCNNVEKTGSSLLALCAPEHRHFPTVPASADSVSALPSDPLLLYIHIYEGKTKHY